MGYTHYWYREKEIDQETFDKIVVDCKKLVPLMEKAGIAIRGGSGEGKPTFSKSLISFNGDLHCGHTERNLGITWPSDTAKGVNQVLITKEPVETDTMVTMLSGEQEKLSVNDSDINGTWFAGCKLEQRTCGGDCSHETFYFQRRRTPDYKGQKAEKDTGKWFSCTKTAYKPYDLMVNCALIICKHYLKDKITVHSDGESYHWDEGRIICQRVLGYGNDFKIDE